MAIPDLISIVVRDMAAALAFYRLLGLDIPATADAEGHVEVITAGGFRIVSKMQYRIQLEHLQGLEDHRLCPQEG